MKVEILSRELIKPYTATPFSFRNYDISLIDELAPTMNVPTFFYYSASDRDNNSLSTCKHLKKSLSNTLTSFHPFAGRYRIDSHSVDCSDQGVDFVEVKVDVSLNDLLRQRMTLKTELLNDLLACTMGAADEYTDPLLAVQVSVFTCGGFAIAVCSSHRIADMFTTISFIKAWAIATKQELGYIDENYKPLSFNFDSALLFPGMNLPSPPSGLPRDKQNAEVHKIITKIFYFKRSKISSIRESATLGDPNKKLPSRVQSVFGVIEKAIIDVHVANPDNPKTYIFHEAVNMRERTVPPLPKNQFGNLFLVARAEPVAGPNGVDLPSIVDLLSNSVKRSVDKCGMLLLLGKDEQQTMISHEHHELIKSLLYPDIYNGGTFTSWCNFPFYEADFGWGEPSWVSVNNFPLKNTVVLVDDKSGEGIEAWVSLDEIDMQKFIKQSDIADIMNYN